MEGSRRGRPRKYSGINGSVSDDAAYLALIWEADGKVSKAAEELGHQGTRSFYTALARLRKRINGDMAEDNPHYDFLYAFESTEKRTWTENGIKLVRAGQELLRTKKRVDDEEEKDHLQNIHLTKCRTPLYANTEILVSAPDRESNFEIFYICRSCLLMMRNFSTVEFSKWRNEHPEIYSALNGGFQLVRDPNLKFG